jgi:hypothetical protein
MALERELQLALGADAGKAEDMGLDHGEHHWKLKAVRDDPGFTPMIQTKLLFDRQQLYS